VDWFRSGLVEITRDFLTAYRLTRNVEKEFRAGTLGFDEVKRLIGDDEGSCLYRLKERCHAFFRPSEEVGSIAMRREALFDLAVGSLFHEAMKFRESFYQREVYGPKVRALKTNAAADAGELFREFEKILAAAQARAEESLQEMEALLVQTRTQFVGLLWTHRDNGLIARYLCGHHAEVAELFPDGLDALLAQVYEDAAEGYAAAAHSFLESGFFEEADAALQEALTRRSSQLQLPRLRDYAQGMAAYLAGDYAAAVAALARWLKAEPEVGERRYAALAYAALSHLGSFLVAEKDEALQGAAAALAQRLKPLASTTP